MPFRPVDRDTDGGLTDESLRRLVSEAFADRSPNIPAEEVFRRLRIRIASARYGAL